MNQRWILLALCLGSAVAAAKEQPLPLARSAAAALRGKSVVVTRHEKPIFVAMAPGKALFGLIGAAAAASAGNSLVDKDLIGDPAEIVETILVPAVVKHYGLLWDPSVTPVINAKKPKDIAASQSGVDYVLDVRSLGWNFLYYVDKPSTYSVAYKVQVRLIEARSGTLLTDMVCNADTRNRTVAPTKAALIEDDARLLKEVTAGLGWTCAKILAQQQFLLSADATPAIPSSYVDPLTVYARAHPADSTAPTEESTRR